MKAISSIAEDVTACHEYLAMRGRSLLQADLYSIVFMLRRRWNVKADDIVAGFGQESEGARQRRAQARTSPAHTEDGPG